MSIKLIIQTKQSARSQANLVLFSDEKFNLSGLKNFFLTMNFLT